MLCFDVHVNGALIFLNKGAMRALEFTRIGANVIEGHVLRTYFYLEGKFNFCGAY